jgi:shikimate kinase
VEDRAGMSVPEIFETYGEEKFREAEHNTICETLNNQPCILATGGGAVCNPDTLKHIKDTSISVWLKSDISQILERAQKTKNRPLLQTDDPETTLKQLMQTRRGFYEQADIHFDLDHNSIDEATDNLIDVVYNFVS